MRVSPTGQSEYHNGNEVLRYGRDGSETYAIWYHSGIGGEAVWAMDTEVEWKISVSVDTILVADANNGLYAIERGPFSEHTRVLDGREQCIVTEDHEAVTYVGDPNDHLRGKLWIESGNQKDTHYHQKANHA